MFAAFLVFSSKLLNRLCAIYYLPRHTSEHVSAATCCSRRFSYCGAGP